MTTTTKKKEATPVDTSKAYICIWYDDSKTPRAFGVSCDKREARKRADKERAKYEKKNNVDITSFQIFTVSLVEKK